MAVNINVPSQVKTYANLAAFPATGALKTIYIAEDTNKTYRWTGSVYTEISASAAMTWGAIGGTLSNQTDLQNALDAKQDDITLTTTGSSGASTLVGSTLNVPNYTLSGLGGVPTSRTLTINGVTQDLSANRTFTISTGITIGSTAITSGSVGRILFEGAGNVVQESSSLFWDATNNRLGIGTSTPFGSFDVRDGDIFATISSNSNLRSRLTYQGLYVSRSTDGGYPENIISTSSAWLYNSRNSHSFFRDGVNLFNVGGGFTSGAMNINTNGNVLIGTTTDAGFRLDVNGTARVQNTTTITKGASNYITFEPSANGTSPFLDMFFSGQVSTRISLGTTSSTRVFLFRDLGTSLGMGIDCGAIFSNSNAILIGGAEQKVQIAGTTNNYLQFTQAGTSNRGTIGYAAGQSYMQIRVNGATDLATGTLSTAFFSTGNVGINTTTDAGFRLDVNGTARVKGTGNTSATSSLVCDNSDNVRYLDVKNDGNIFVKTTRAFRHEVSNGVFYFDLGNIIVRNGDATAASTMSIGKASTADASSILDLVSTTRGFLPPRMTTTQKNAIASPAAGLMVYDTTLNVISYYNGSMWI